ncbi:esterase, partial [Streptomyces violascens]
KSDIGVLYNNGQSADGRNQSTLWAFTGKTDGLNAGVRWWDSGNDSWNWNASQLAAGDITGDGKADLAVHYDYGQGADGRNRARIWTFTSTGTAMNPPRSDWDSLIG